MSGCRRRVTARVLRADAPVLCGLLAEWRALIANMTVPELRVPPGGAEIERLIPGWRDGLGNRRKFVPAARDYAAARLEAGVGLPVHDVRIIDLDHPRLERGLLRKAKGRRRTGA